MLCLGSTVNWLLLQVIMLDSTRTVPVYRWMCRVLQRLSPLTIVRVLILIDRRCYRRHGRM